MDVRDEGKEEYEDAWWRSELKNKPPEEEEACGI